MATSQRLDVVGSSLLHVFPDRPNFSCVTSNMRRGKITPPTENPESDQRLQKITLCRVPIPDKNIDCQTLLRRDVSLKGWLRRKKPGKLTSALGSLLPSMMWEQMFVVLCKGCLYFYNNESEKKPTKAISLFGYTRVMRANELQYKQAGGVWPFKLAYVLDEHDRVHYLNASCEEEMMNWLKHIKLELYKANGVEYSNDSIIDEDIHDLETPISTGNYFDRMEDLKKIKEVVKDDSDMDSDYDYIEPDEHQPKKKVSVVTPPPKPGRAIPQRLPKTSRASPPSPGYYPPSVPDQDSSSGDSAKSLPTPPTKKLPPTPVLKPNKPDTKAKERPAVLAKPKASSTSGEGGSRDWAAKTPSGETFPSAISVADLQKAIKKVASKPPVSGKASVQPLKKTPGHFALAETLSESHVSTSKPLPPAPGQARTSSAPTAVVIPIRQSDNSQNRFTQDLEASALWTEDPGEGQRLLMALGREGAYMVRCCSDGSQSRTLLVIADCQLRKYKIFTNEAGMFSLQTDFVPRFDSVHNLLNHYRTNNLPNRQSKLSLSYSELQRR